MGFEAKESCVYGWQFCPERELRRLLFAYRQLLKRYNMTPQGKAFISELYNANKNLLK
jgi:hypothetical protein